MIKKIVIIVSSIFAFDIFMLFLGISVPVAVMVTFISILIALKNDFTTLYWFIFLVVFQNFFLIIFSDNLDYASTSIIKACKEIMLYLQIIVSYIIYKKKIKKIILLFIPLIIYLSLNFIFSVTSVGLRITALRSLIIPMVCFIFGINLNRKEKDIKNFYNILMLTSVFLSLSGLIIYFLNDNIWIKLGILRFYENSGIEGGIVRFVSYDFGKAIKRFVSITADPLATSHLLAFAFWCFLLQNKKTKEKLVCVPILFVCLILGASKGFLLMCIVAITLIIYTKINNIKLRRLCLFAFVIIGIFGFKYLNYYTENVARATATSIHFQSLSNSIDTLSVFGTGLGTAGYNVEMRGMKSELSYNESYFATLLAQTGIVGIICFYSPLVYVDFIMLKKYLNNKEKDLLMAILCMSSIILESIFSSSSISMQGTAIYFIYCGIIYNNYFLGLNDSNTRKDSLGNKLKYA